MVLITLFIALSTLLYYCQTIRFSACVLISSERNNDVSTWSGIASVGPTLVGSTNGIVMRRVYAAGGAVKTR